MKIRKILMKFWKQGLCIKNIISVLLQQFFCSHLYYQFSNLKMDTDDGKIIILQCPMCGKRKLMKIPYKGVIL